jgi:hypothetical protein
VRLLWLALSGVRSIAIFKSTTSAPRHVTMLPVYSQTVHPQAPPSPVALAHDAPANQQHKTQLQEVTDRLRTAAKQHRRQRDLHLRRLREAEEADLTGIVFSPSAALQVHIPVLRTSTQPVRETLDDSILQLELHISAFQRSLSKPFCPRAATLCCRQSTTL